MEKVNKPQEPEIIDKSKYELTLAEFPVFLLSNKGIKDIKSIEYHDMITGREGELVKREWKVLPHSELGFGTASTFETFFELFQIWKEVGFTDQYVQFGSIFNLLKRMGKKTGKSQYTQVAKDLETLVGITIKAKNAF